MNRLVAALIGLVAVFMFSWSGTISARAEEPAGQKTTAPPLMNAAETESAAVVIKGKRLFVYYAILGGRTPMERAEQTTTIIRRLIDSPSFDPDSIKIEETAVGTQVVAGGEVVANVSINDARIAGSTSHVLASEFASKLRVLLSRNEEKENSPAAIATGVAISVGLTVLLFLLVTLVTKCTAAICRRIRYWEGTKIQSIKIQQAELLSASTLAHVLLNSTKIISIVICLNLIIGYLLVVLSSFAATRPFASAILDESLTPLYSMAEKMLSYVPNVLAIVIIALITYAVMAFSRFFFSAIEARTISFADFDPEWADPTYKLVRILIIAFAAVAALPYCPGWESESFKQVGLFLGILFSLGSTSVVGNVMAGTVLTYTNAFKVGDRIKVGESVGDVVEKTLFVTRICTPKNEIVSLPNGCILNSTILNFSSHAKQGQLILHTTVSIGYAADWRVVHKLLIEAARATENILQEPAPFVLQSALNDFYVSYEINAYTDKASLIPLTYSSLHENIQDRFNEAGIEIMSPHYSNLRDGNEITIPSQFRDSDYKAPPFHVKG